MWNDATRRETRAVLKRIPMLDWDAVSTLFRPEARQEAEGDLSHVTYVEDPQDRKFAALALSAKATLVSADDHLPAHHERLDVSTPGEFLRKHLGSGDCS